MPTLPNPSDYARPMPKGSGLYYDPLYGYIPLPPIIRRAINLPTVQRLRHIKQLSVLDLVFPGATHTRFEHSVGVYHLATMVGSAILTKQAEQPEMAAMTPTLVNQLLALQLAAIFHDVGHGPYSHTFEEFQQRHKLYADTRHDKITRRLIREGIGQYKDIPAFLDHEVSVKQRIAGEEAEWLSPRNVSAIAVGEPPPKDTTCVFLHEIITGDFGVDRLDYLRRDSFHTGLGTGFVDVWEIVHSYDIMDDGVAKVIRLHPKVAQAVEALITTRDMVFRRAYYAPAHRVAEEMLIAALHAVQRQYAPDDLALCTDDELVNRLLHGPSALAADLAQRIKFRRLYETLPLQIDVQKYLDPFAAQRLRSILIELKDASYQDVWKLCDTLSQDLGFGPDKTIILDLQSPALTKARAYRKPYFHDSLTEQSFNLLDLMPHLRLSHGTRHDVTGTTQDLHALHERMLTKLLISVPYDWIRDCVDKGILKHNLDGQPPAEQYQQAASIIYKDAGFDAIIQGLAGLLKMQDREKRSTLENDFENSTVSYLKTLLREQVATNETP